MSDVLYKKINYQPSEVTHKYGANIHLMADLLSLSRLELLGRPSTCQPTINDLINKLYDQLLIFAAGELPRQVVTSETRMSASSGHKWTGEVLDNASPVVIAGIARAGTMPAEKIFAELCQILDPKQVRIDHLYMARQLTDDGGVCGNVLSGHKIGGSIEGATLLIPDPMGATGGTILKTLALYRELGLGTPRAVIALHLIITPEYVQNIAANAPNVAVYALRLDRGLSSECVLSALPGEFPAEERGLNDKDYIIPGLGGVGELMSNSFV